MLHRKKNILIRYLKFLIKYEKNLNLVPKIIYFRFIKISDQFEELCRLLFELHVSRYVFLDGIYKWLFLYLMFMDNVSLNYI